MTSRLDRKVYFAPTLINKKPREIVLFSALLLTILGILAPLTSAQKPGYDPPTLIFDSIDDNVGGSALACAKDEIPNCGHESPAEPGSKPAQDLKNQPPTERFRGYKSPDFNRDIYYRNKLRILPGRGMASHQHPFFLLTFFVGDNYNTYPLNYTLVPVFASLRWQLDNVGSPWILRGNWDLTFTGSITAIPRGPESHYLAYLMGLRRNFVPRRGKNRALL